MDIDIAKMSIDEKKNQIAKLTSERMNFMQKGQTLEEAEVLRILVILTKEVYGEESDETVKILNELGGTLKYISDFEEAEKAILTARSIIEKKYGDNNISYATCSLNLAEVYRFMKKFDETEKIYLDSMKIYANNNLQNDYLFASICNNLGLFYQELQKYEKALPLHEKSLEILEKLPEYQLQYATTLSNLVIPYAKAGNKEKSEQCLKKSLELIEKQVGKEHSLYSASLNNLAINYFNQGELEKALELFLESAEICKRSFGEESGNYKNLISNIEFVKETIEKKKALKENKNIKGLELSKRYFYEVCLPKIEKEIPEILNRVAVGLVGEGSECFGFDDEISVDHDFGASCCFWLTDEDYEKYGLHLEKILIELPKEFLGFPALEISEWSSKTGKRRGVLKISDWYYKFLGKEKAPETLNEWRLIPEISLSTATNGEIFLDKLGKFTEIRENIMKYFPEDIRKNKIATRCMKIAQSGQYNFERSMKRNEIVGARLAETEFLQEVIHLVYLLNRKYVLFYKWAFKGLKTLDILGKDISEMIEKLVLLRVNETSQKVYLIEKICEKLIEELKNQNLVPKEMKSNFLQDYAPLIQSSIEDEKLRNLLPIME